MMTSVTLEIFRLSEKHVNTNECTEHKTVTMADQLDDKEIQEILKTGTDLRQYSRQIEKEFKEVENKSIEDYIKESQNIANLHNQIGNCDTILERMESMLLNFQVGILLDYQNRIGKYRLFRMSCVTSALK